MDWKFIDPLTVNPELFDLSKVSTCKVRNFSGTENMRFSAEWRLYADLLDKCPVTGQQLEEFTWFLFAAQGQP